MSTSLLYHAFGIREYKYVRTEYHEGHTIFTIKKENSQEENITNVIAGLSSEQREILLENLLENETEPETKPETENENKEEEEIKKETNSQ